MDEGRSRWPELLEDVFDSAPVGLAVWDRTLRCAAVNTAFAQLSGGSADAQRGRTPGELLGELAATVERMLHGVFTGGRPAVDREVVASPPVPTRGRRWRVTCFAVGDNRDHPAYAVTAIAGAATPDGPALRASEERFRLLVEGVTDYAILMLDAEGRVASWNAGAERITGYTAEEIVGAHVARFHTPEAVAHGEPGALLETAATQGRVATENWRVRKDGGRFWASVVVTALRRPDGGLRGFAKVVHDLTDRRAADQALRASETTLRNVLESAPSGIMAVDASGRIQSANTRAERMFGYRPGELVGQPIELLVPQRLRGVHRRYRDGYMRAPEARLMGRGLDLTARRRDGSEFPVEVGLGVERGSGADNSVVTVVVTDITQRKEAEEQLAHQATHDVVTGLPNRALFCDRLLQALNRAGRAGSMVAVLFLDLDRFKVINDSLGHEAGDEVLRAVARRLEEIGRQHDTVARFGGDEFAMLCEGLSGPRDAVRIAERVLDRLTLPLPVAHSREQTVTASIGIALADRPPADVNSLLADADAAMYRAKERGKARFDLFDAELRQQAMDRLDLENGLRQAADAGQLRLLYQPIVALGTGEVVGAEALLRWRHPTRGMLSPHDFIAVAEETGLIAPVGDWALREACMQAARWQRALPDGAVFQVSVNLSARQLAQPDLGDSVRRALELSGLEPDRLQLEITESGLMTDLGASVSVMRDLSALGVPFAIDDFGTGYSSLSRLRQFPVNALKIDREFVGGVGREAADCAIVDAVVSLARSYGITAVAEGVETGEQEAALIRLGCRYAQGFYYARPTPASRIDALLRSAPPTAGIRAESD